MAYISNANQTIEPAVGIGASFRATVNRFNAWRSYRATVRALSDLTDAELNDIGVARSEIKERARKGR